jgi:surface protein
MSLSNLKQRTLTVPLMKNNKPLALMSLLSLSILSACGGGSASINNPSTTQAGLQPHQVSERNLKTVNVISRDTFSAPVVTSTADSITITHTPSSGRVTGRHYQFFLNTDNDAATGFRFDGEAWDKAGTDYIVEDGHLFKSTANDSSWSWNENVGSVEYHKTASSVSVTIKKSLLQGLKPVVRIGLMKRNADWDVKAIYPRSTLMAEYRVEITPPADTLAPVITLNGSANIVVQQGADFTDPGATAKDNVDGVITDQIVTDSNVDTSQVGDYRIIYTATDNAGNTAKATRKVKVIETTPTGITIDGNNSDWADIPDTSNDSAGTIKATNKNGKLYLMIDAQNIGENTQIFLDTDNDSATGFLFGGEIWNQGGADYMIENTHLDKAKVNSSAWSWDYDVGRIEIARSGNIIEVAIPTNLLANLGNTINIGFVNRDAEWNVKSAVPETALVAYTLGQTPPPPPSEVGRPLMLNVKGYKYSGRGGTFVVKDYKIFTNPNYSYNYNVDCNSDGVMEATGLTGSYTCEYTDQDPNFSEHTISITGQFPAIYQLNSFNAKMIVGIEQWGSQEWLSMENAFKYSGLKAITATDLPDLSKVTSMQDMFTSSSFPSASNGANTLANWDVSNITNMKGLFNYSKTANPDISGWDVSNVTDMTHMFRIAQAFNQDIGNWNVSNVKTMQGMFSGADSFNQNINRWNVSNVKNMSNMLAAHSFNQPLDNWDVSNVIAMDSLFYGAKYFNQDISNWNVSNVKIMQGMFNGAEKFNKAIGNWNVSQVSHLGMGDMFKNAKSFNQDISNWDVSNVDTMSGMFSGAESFNQAIGSWNVENVTNMRGIFSGAAAFNQDLKNWNMSNVTDTSDMFSGAIIFNQDISNWNLSKVRSMVRMFQNAKTFNQDIGGWDVSNVEYMQSMFDGAVSFDRDIGTWNVSKVLRMFDMFKNVTLSISNYDSLLNKWSQLTLHSNHVFDGGNSKYSSAGAAARQKLITQFGWTITDGGQTYDPLLARQMLPVL